MAMRNLLRRIPALAPSGPLMRPVHGVSPAMAAAVPAPSGPLMRPVHGVSPARAAAVIPRFLSTQSEGGHGSRKSALDAYLESEEEAARTWKLIDAKHKEIMETNKKIRLEIDQLEEDGRCLDRYNRYLFIWIVSAAAIMSAWGAFVSYKMASLS